MDTPITTPLNLSTTPIPMHSGADSASYLQGRYILTTVGPQPITFPVQWVAEILVIERSTVLPLPFYSTIVLGVVHHQGKMIPLLQTPQGGIVKSAAPPSRLMKESLSVVRLNAIVQPLANVGLVVDQVIGSLPQDQLTNEVASRFDRPIRPFQPDDIPPTVWQPREGGVMRLD
jgi:chemotaxis signal transduction protein